MPRERTPKQALSDAACAVTRGQLSMATKISDQALAAVPPPEIAAELLTIAGVIADERVNCNGICPDSCNDIWPLWIPNTPFTLSSLGILDEYTQVKRGCTAGSSIGVHGHIAWQKCGQIPMQFTRFGGDNREIRIASLLVNMEALFESYLRSSLATNLAQTDSNIWVLDGNNKGNGGALKPLFDQEYPDDIARATEAKPDIVCSYRSPKDGMTSNALVIDVKYKVVKKVSARSDLEQAITYGLSYRSDIILLVHPRTNERHGLYPQGHIGKLEVYQYIFDLSADSLADEEILFAQRIYELIQASTG